MGLELLSTSAKVTGLAATEISPARGAASTGAPRRLDRRTDTHCLIVFVAGLRMGDQILERFWKLLIHLDGGSATTGLIDNL